MYPTDIGWPVTDVGWPVTDVGWPVTDVSWPVTDVGWLGTDGSWPVTDVSWPVTDVGCPLSPGADAVGQSSFSFLFGVRARPGLGAENGPSGLPAAATTRIGMNGRKAGRTFPPAPPRPRVAC